MLATGPIDINDAAELLERTAHHPVIRWGVFESFMQAWAWNAAAAWTATGSRGLSVYVIGEPVDAGHLARAVLAGDVPQAPTDVASVSVPRGTLETVRLPVGTGDDWDFYWTQASPRPRPGESHAVDLDLADRSVRAELDDLVRISSPRASARPGDDRVRRWMGIRDPRDGQLVACAAHAEHVPGVPVLKTIATHPGRRGEGLGRDITAAITRRAFAGGAEVVTLGMYADNLPARRAYERLGFTLGAEFSSRGLLSSS